MHKVQKLDQTQFFFWQRFPQSALKWEVKERKSSCSRKETKILSCFFYEPHFGGLGIAGDLLDLPPNEAKRF